MCGFYTVKAVDVAQSRVDTLAAETPSNFEPAHPSRMFELEARLVVRSEMQRRGVTYKELARRLELRGFSDSPRALAMRVNRGTFTFAFAIAVFRVLEITSVNIAELPTSLLRPD